jgi:hypothetical protein
MIQFEILKPQVTAEHLGVIPYYFSYLEAGTAEDQMNAGYARSAGGEPGDYWNKNQKHKIDETGALKYPGDSKLTPLAKAAFRGDTLRFYDYAIFSIQKPDGSFKVWRLD